MLSYPDDATGTKNCNSCHDEGKRGQGNLGVNEGLLSKRIEPAVGDVIFTTDPDVAARIKKAKDEKKYVQLKDTKDEDLASICKCIDDNKGKEPFTEESGKLALALCKALMNNFEGADGGDGGGGAGGRGGAGGSGSVGGTSGASGEGGTQADDASNRTDAGSSEGGSAGSDGNGGVGGSLLIFDASARGSVPEYHDPSAF